MIGSSMVVDGGPTPSGPGPEFATRLNLDADRRGPVGMNYGTTGTAAIVWQRPT
jgi:hypothetical protein